MFLKLSPYELMIVNLCHPNLIRMSPHKVNCTRVWQAEAVCYDRSTHSSGF